MINYNLLSAAHFILGIIFLIMGIWALTPSEWAGEPIWHAYLKIILGLVIIAAGYKLYKNSR
ncbi:hypothetical protein [Methanobacterium alcaliphilum]|uniref:hypothetical protein n=1 Tax=Methanobacterium alcaliphilum TaxID=392018 RepID=UPI00200A59F4|nr:hypothetical protein [Methanobacterium alcaliphilum]MCK9152017.1 hypothetical protein [Methanobacterium alcaliphilum]